MKENKFSMWSNLLFGLFFGLQLGMWITYTEYTPFILLGVYCILLSILLIINGLQDIPETPPELMTEKQLKKHIRKLHRKQKGEYKRIKNMAFDVATRFGKHDESSWSNSYRDYIYEDEMIKIKLSRFNCIITLVSTQHRVFNINGTMIFQDGSWVQHLEGLMEKIKEDDRKKLLKDIEGVTPLESPDRLCADCGKKLSDSHVLKYCWACQESRNDKKQIQLMTQEVKKHCTECGYGLTRDEILSNAETCSKCRAIKEAEEIQLKRSKYTCYKCNKPIPSHAKHYKIRGLVGFICEDCYQKQLGSEYGYKMFVTQSGYYPDKWTDTNTDW